MHTVIRSLLLVLIVAGIPIQLAAQAKPAGTDAAVAAIKAEFARINAQALHSETFRYEEAGCAEDGKVIYASAQQAIVKVTESGSIGDGSWVREFYYRAGRLIFCYERLTGGPAAGPVMTTEHRFYIANDRVIRFMEGSKIIPIDSRATETVQTAYKLLKAYTTRNFAAALCR